MGLRFIIGVANQVSSELYVKCFKFKLISQLAVKVGLSTFKKKIICHTISNFERQKNS